MYQLNNQRDEEGGERRVKQT